MENLFDLSFIVKDGMARVVVDPDTMVPYVGTSPRNGARSLRVTRHAVLGSVAASLSLRYCGRALLWVDPSLVHPSPMLTTFPFFALLSGFDTIGINVPFTLILFIVIDIVIVTSTQSMWLILPSWRARTRLVSPYTCNGAGGSLSVFSSTPMPSHSRV